MEEFSNRVFADVTVILTVWKRNNIAVQLERICRQSVAPKYIWVYHCGNFVDLSSLKTNIHFEYIKSTVNLGYFGRFTLSTLTNSRYVWIIDDDVIPSFGWLEYCLGKCVDTDVIVASSGRIIPQNDYYPERPANLLSKFIGDGDTRSPYNLCSSDTFVDFGCNSWIFDRRYASSIYQIPPLTFETGEDIHFSASAFLCYGAKTIVPMQLSLELTGNEKKELGYDVFSSWKRPGFLEKRARIIANLVHNHNWKPILW